MSELGTKLRDARIEKGYTLNTLQQMTKIQKKYLVAIEEGRFEEIPGNFYIRAFVKQYADMVGIDGDELLLEYQAELDAVEHGVTQYEEPNESVMPSRLVRNQNQPEAVWYDRFAKRAPLAILIMVVLVIMSGIAYAILQTTRQERQQTAQTSSAVGVVSSVEPNAAANNTASSSVSVSSTPKVEGGIQVGQAQIKLISGEGEETTYALYSPMTDYHFSVKGKGLVWVGVYEDEQITQDTTVAEGETLDIKVNAATRSVRIRLGYVEGGTILVNNTEVKIDNPYITDSIVFRLNDTVPAVTPDETTQSVNAEDGNLNEENGTNRENTTSYEGPAVLDPNRRNRNNE